MIVNQPRKALLAGLFLWAGCTLSGCMCNNPASTTSTSSTPGQTAASSVSGSSEAAAGSNAADNTKLIDRGRTVYNTNCIACHNSNPKLAGSLGPDVHGSSLELLQTRVMRAAYPEGYKPKKPSAAMPAMPYLKNDIPALHAFLNQP